MHEQTKAYIFAGGAVLLWSTVASAFKLTLHYFDPAQLVLLASTFSIVALFIVIVVQNKLKLLLQTPIRHFFLCFLLGMINPCLYYSVLFEAYDRLPAQEAMSINYSWPAMLVLLAILFLRQNVRGIEWIAICIAYAGVVVIATNGNVSALKFDEPLGVGLALASTLIWSVFWLLNVKQTVDPVVTLFFSFALALPVLFTAVAIVNPIDKVTVQGLLGAAYIGFFEMGITFVLWLTALKLSRSTAKISMLVFITPFLSLVFIHIVVGESIRPVTLAGLALIVGGMALEKTLHKRDRIASR